MAAFKMGKVVLRSLFKKPATLMYPVVPRQYYENTRGHIAIDVETCILCGICQRRCPANAIEVNRQKKTWMIERMKCVQCSGCVVVCPKDSLSNMNTYTQPETQKVVDTFTIPVKEAPKPAAKVEKPVEAKVEKAADVPVEEKAEAGTAEKSE